VIDRPGLLVVDDVAERCLAGVSVASGEGARQAIGRLSAADFYDRQLWSVVVAAASLPVGLRDGDDEWNEACRLGDSLLVSHGCASRVAALATAYERSWLVALVMGRSVDRDVSGYFADRVRRAAAARREIWALKGEIEQRLRVMESLGADVDRIAVERTIAGYPVLTERAQCEDGLGVDVGLLVDVASPGNVLCERSVA
jgi:hypothetical protein